MTNRDRINKLNNAELSLLIQSNTAHCECCVFNPNDCRRKSCADGIKKWLDLKYEDGNKIGLTNYDSQCNEDLPDNNVDHPAHYNFGKIEVIDFIEQQHLGFHLGNSVKYISRAGRKDPAKTIEDLKKAAWYLNRQIEKLERELGGQNK